MGDFPVRHSFHANQSYTIPMADQPPETTERDTDNARRLGADLDESTAERRMVPREKPAFTPREPKDLGAFYERAKRLGLYKYGPPTEPGS